MRELGKWLGVWSVFVGVLLLAPLSASAQGPLFVSHPANAFVPRDADLAIIGGAFGPEGIYATCQQGPYCEFFRPANLPNGSTFLGAELDGCSEVDELFTTAPMGVYVIRRGINGGTKTMLAGKLFAPNPADECHFEYAVPAEPVAIDTFNNDYIVAVTVGDPDCQIQPQTCPILQPRFQGVRLYYTTAASGTVEPTTPAQFNPLPPP